MAAKNPKKEILENEPNEKARSVAGKEYTPQFGNMFTNLRFFNRAKETPIESPDELPKLKNSSNRKI